MRKLICVVIFAFIAMGSASMVLADQATEAKEMVDKAVDLFKDKGKDQALKIIGLSSGPFRKGELYTFAAGFDNVVLSHPVNKDFIGKSTHELKDASGKLFAREFLEVAKNQGAGWVDYTWLRHGEKEPTPKRAYIKRVPGEDIYVGAGFYVK
jgi:cytochrome c